MGKREEVGAIVADLKRHGFTQLRKTDHGWLYGMREFRFVITNGLADPGSIDQSAIEVCRREWERTKSAVLAAYPGLKLAVVARLGTGGQRPAEVEQMEPVTDIEAALADVMGGAGAAPEPVMLAGEGSTPSRSAITESARSEPAAALPVAAPLTEGAPMRKRKPYTGWTCPKCGKHFKTPGRHAQSCTGTAAAPAPAKEKVARARRNGAGKLHGPVKTIAAGDYADLIASFESASAALSDGVRALLIERDLYRRERDEAAKAIEAARMLFNPTERK